MNKIVIRSSIGDGSIEDPRRNIRYWDGSNFVRDNVRAYPSKAKAAKAIARAVRSGYPNIDLVDSVTFKKV